MAQASLIIYGTVTESSTPVNAITVKARNERTNNTTSVETNSNGQFVLDAANIEGGYLDGDQITVYTIYSNFEGQETVTVALPTYLYEQDIALSAIEDSEEIDYCTVQDVYDELDGKTSADIATTKIIKAIQRAEGQIDLKTDTSFKVNTETDEIHSVNRYNIEASPENLDSSSGSTPQRADRWGCAANRVKVNNTPLISITSLSTNSAAVVSADSWTELTQHTGTVGGDYMISSKDAGLIDFLTNYPSMGERRWKTTYTWGHDPDSTDRKIMARVRVAQRLTIVLAAKMILSRKSSGSIFDSTRDIRIGTIEIKGSGQSTSQHIGDMGSELADLWKSLGDLGVEVI